MPVPPSPTEHTIRPYPLSRLVIVTAGLIAALGLITGSMLYASYQDALREQQITLRNVAIAFAAQTAGVARAIDNAARQAARMVLSPPANPSSGLADSEEGLAHPYLLRIVLFDAAGRPVGSVTPGNEARKLPSFPKAPAGGAARRITITDIDRATGRGILNFAQPIHDRGGRRIGSAVAQVDSVRFEHLYNLVELGKGGSVTLLHRDGTMLVRGPGFPAGIGRNFADTPLFREQLPRASRGSFESTSPLTGEAGLYGYDTVEGAALVIITGMARDVALASWYGRLWTALAFYLLLAAVLSLLAWRVGRDTRRQFNLIDMVSASEARLAKSFDYLASIVNAVGAPIWVLDGARRIVLANDAFARLVGRPRETLPGLDERSVLPGADPERERRYDEVLALGKTLDATGTMHDGSGESRTVIQLTTRLTGDDGAAHLVNVLTDITERERAEARLAWLAEFDALTGLPNQAQFWRLLEARIAACAAGGRELAVVALVLERLHEVVDLLGHDAGDRALRQVADLLRGACAAWGAGDGAVAARIRGGEFAFVLDAGGGRREVERFAMELHALSSAALQVDGRDFFLDPVLGVALFPQDGRSADELYRSAQGAASGAGVEVDEAVHFFSASRHTELGQRLTVEAHLRRALERGELRLVYQPKVTVQEQEVVGVEALLRWTNPVLGEVSPAEFVPIAERTGLILPIGAWVLEQACRQMDDWSARLGLPVKVAVNLSPRQFHQKSLLDTIRRCLAQYRVTQGCLELEITETALMSREQEVDRLMHEIRRLGVDLSIDDFGTGYSSLAYLKRFPVSRLKVDRAFVRDLGRDEDSAAIALSIVNLARGLKLKVVAEGVETEAQLAALRGMACDEYQGFLFSKPLERDAVEALLARRVLQDGLETKERP